jgi:hypothetical protein
MGFFSFVFSFFRICYAFTEVVFDRELSQKPVFSLLETTMLNMVQKSEKGRVKEEINLMLFRMAKT